VGVTCLWSVESNAGVGDHDRVAQKALEGDDRVTDMQTDKTQHYTRIYTAQVHRKQT